MLTLRILLPRCGKIVQCVEKSNLNGAALLRTIHKHQIPAIGGALQNRYATTATNSNSNTNEKQWQRVYYGSLAPRMKAVKLFSLTTSCAGLAAQPILMEQGLKLGGTGLAVLFCSFAGFFTFVTPVLLHLITKKYVTEMHYNPATGEYLATTISLFLKKIETKFRPSDVKVPDVPGMFTSFFVGKKPLFVDPALFENTDHYVRIMGYDKPIDFKFDFKENASATAAANTATTTEAKADKSNAKQQS